MSKNQNSECTIPIVIKRYNTYLKRLKGLMFQVKPIQNEGILLEPCNSIHMFFMFFPIDVVFLNRDNQAVKVKENVAPWSAIFPVKHAYKALELPIGTIKKYALTEGCTIKLTNLSNR
ncbi:DUF192 domain-containing protein [Fredinandcohnia humi]